MFCNDCWICWRHLNWILFTTVGKLKVILKLFMDKDMKLNYFLEKLTWKINNNKIVHFYQAIDKRYCICEWKTVLRKSALEKSVQETREHRKKRIGKRAHAEKNALGKKRSRKKNADTIILTDHFWLNRSIVTGV